MSPRGQATVEFALAIPIFLVLVLGTVELSRAVWQQSTLAYAVREATRYAIVHGSGSASPVPYCASCSDATITDVVAQNAIGITGASVTVAFPDGNNDRGSRVTVSATVPFLPAAVVGQLAVTLSAQSTLTIER